MITTAKEEVNDHVVQEMVTYVISGVIGNQTIQVCCQAKPTVNQLSRQEGDTYQKSILDVNKVGADKVIQARCSP